jgi:hypothetical protein
MPSTYTSSLRLVKQAAGENSSTWGTLFNQQFSDLIDTAISGYATKALADADTTLTASNGAADESRSMGINFTGALTAARNVIVPTTSKLYYVKNGTTGGFALTIKTSAGTGISVRNGGSAVVFCDGTNVVDPITQLPTTTTINDNVVGYLDIPQNSKSIDYTLVLGDAGKHIYHPVADTTGRTWTIPANASVAYPVGTTLTFVNDLGAGTITLSITSDTLVFAPSGGTGSRTLAAAGVATALKMTSTRWIISGSGIT